MRGPFTNVMLDGYETFVLEMTCRCAESFNRVG